MRYTLLACLFFACANLYGQSQHVQFSEKHLQRLENLRGRTRLIRYLSYFKKDSTRWARELEKKEFTDLDPLQTWDAPDSTTNALGEVASEDFHADIVRDLSTEGLAGTLLKDYDPSEEFGAYFRPGIDTSFAVDKLLDESLHQSLDKIQGSEHFQRVSSLLRKYREYANSADLSNATRQSSLAGRPGLNRVVAGMNFQTSSWEPLTMDLAPMLGYRLTKRLQIGAGFNYRFLAEERDPHTWSFAARDYRLFSSYLVTPSLFAQAEWEERMYEAIAPDNVANRWRTNFNIGVGKKLLIHPKMYFTVTALYNVSPRINSDRFNVRFGFEVSELAIRQRTVRYDPNQR